MRRRYTALPGSALLAPCVGLALVASPVMAKKVSANTPAIHKCGTIGIMKIT